MPTHHFMQLGIGFATVLYGFSDIIFRILAGLEKVSGSMLSAET